MFITACSTSRKVSDPAASYADAEDVLAVIDGNPLTLEEFETRYARSAGGWEDARNKSMEEYEDYLERYVDYQVKVHEARMLGFHEDPEMIREIDEYRFHLARPFIIGERVTRPLARQLHERQQEEVRVSHIMIGVLQSAPARDTLQAYEKITSLLDSLESGADFGDLAARHSEAPLAEHNRGDMGFILAGHVPDTFENAAYSTEIGELSGVFRSPYGFHILRPTERRAVRPPVRVSHILVMPSASTEQAKEEAAEKAAELLERIRQGEDFAELAREESDDRGSSQNGGDIGFFTYDQVVQPFAEAAYELENIGDVSEVVETNFGHHIIKLTGRQDLTAFEDALPEIRQNLPRMQRYERALESMVREAREHIEARIDSAAIEAAIADFPSDSIAVLFSRGRFSEEDGAREVVFVDTTAYTLADVSEFTRANPRPPGRDQRGTVFQDTGSFLEDRLLDHYTYRLAQDDDEFQELMTQYIEGTLLFRVTQDSVWLPAQETESLRNIYDADPDRYRFPERIRAVSFQHRADSVLQKVAQTLDEGGDIRPLLETYSDGRDQLRVDTTYVADITNSIYDVVHDLSEGEYSPPRRENRDYILVLHDGVEPPRNKTFQEARVEIQNLYQEQVEREWVERLRIRYDVVTFPNRLASVFEGARPDHVPVDPTPVEQVHVP